jgi:hypothetical protein
VGRRERQREKQKERKERIIIEPKVQKAERLLLRSNKGNKRRRPSQVLTVLCSRLIQSYQDYLRVTRIHSDSSSLLHSYTRFNIVPHSRVNQKQEDICRTTLFPSTLEKSVREVHLPRKTGTRRTAAPPSTPILDVN